MSKNDSDGCAGIIGACVFLCIACVFVTVFLGIMAKLFLWIVQ